MRFVLLMLIASSLVASPAMAQGKNRGVKEVESKTLQAMENFDLLEFEAARRQLGEALALARKNKLDGEPILARVYLNLGIVEFAGLKNQEAAREAFAAAVAIDPDIEIGVAYRTAPMADLLRAVKKGRTGGGEMGGSDDGGDECATLSGVEHTPVDQGTGGERLAIRARVGDSVTADKVSLFYRAEGAEKFVEVAMRRRGRGCSYEAAIPAAAMRGRSLHYYVAAQADGQTMASKGSRASPNIVMLSAGAPAAAAAEVGRGAGETPRRPPGAKKTVFISLAVGTGAGYVSGTTEVVGSEVSCCVAPALLHVFPEVGYYFSRRTSLSAAFRMGFALGANVSGHATAAPSGLLRLRHALSESGEGLQISGALGGGIIRHTVKVEEAAADMDTDTTASGPFLVGGGLGYLMPLSGAMNLVAELNALAAFPAGIEEIGPCPGSGCVRPNTSIQADFNLGLLFAF
jgi:hypothetical protein